MFRKGPCSPEQECDNSHQVVFLQPLNQQCPWAPVFLASSTFGPQLEAFPSDSMWDGGFSWLQGELIVEGTQANLTVWDPQKDLTVRVCVSNAAGYGPWSQPLVVSSHDHAGEAYRG